MLYIYIYVCIYDVDVYNAFSMDKVAAAGSSLFGTTETQALSRLRREHASAIWYFSPTAQATGVFSHSKGFGAERSSTKTHSPRFPNRGSQIEVPK